MCPEAAVPPWAGYNEEETIQQQILALSAVSNVDFFKSSDLYLINVTTPLASYPRQLPPCTIEIKARKRHHPQQSYSEVFCSMFRTSVTSYVTPRLACSSTLTWSKCFLWPPSCWRKTSSSTACVSTWCPNSQYRLRVRPRSAIYEIFFWFEEKRDFSPRLWLFFFFFTETFWEFVLVTRKKVLHENNVYIFPCRNEIICNVMSQLLILEEERILFECSLKTFAEKKIHFHNNYFEFDKKRFPCCNSTR